MHSYMARDTTLRSETFRYDRGANQQFKQPAFTVNPAAFDEEDVSHDFAFYFVSCFLRYSFLK